MDWKPSAEQAALGFLGYGAASLALSPSILHFSLSALAGALVGAGYFFLRPIVLKRLVGLSFPEADLPSPTRQSIAGSKLACVSVTRDLQFREVSTRPPEGMGFIRFNDLDKRELFNRLQGKSINHATIPFQMRVDLESGKPVEVSWASMENHLIAG